MNVLVVTNRLEVGGAEHFVVRLSKELSRRGHHVVVASDGGSLAPHLAPPVEWVEVRAHLKTPTGILALAAVLRRIVVEHSIDVIHANSPTTALAARFASWGSHVPVVASAHGVWRDWVKPGVSLLFSVGSDCVVGCSEELTSDLVRHGLTRRKAVAIHNGVPCPQVVDPHGIRTAVRTELGIGQDGPVILAACRLADQKGLAYLIAAMPAILASHPGTVTLIAGDGERRQDLENLAASANLGGAVRFLGNRNDLQRLLVAADVFCLPSVQEGLPLSIAEAMAAGLPVVATAVGGVPEIVLDGETGYLVPPRDPSTLADRLVALLDAPELRRSFGEQGRRRATAHFSLEGMASKFEALYEQRALELSAA